MMHRIAYNKALAYSYLEQRKAPLAEHHFQLQGDAFAINRLSN